MEAVVAVAGPTASGKSECALLLAEALHGEVISIDSVQVYRECDIGSAKLPLQQRAGIQHHLMDIRSPTAHFHAGDFVGEADRVLEELRQRSALAVCCVGTTMYWTALLHGLVAVPEIPPHVRQRIQGLTLSEVRAELLAKDPQSIERIHANDSQRLTRALEIFDVTGRSYQGYLQSHDRSKARYRAITVVLCWPRSELHRRIARRAEAMLKGGLEEEVAALVERYGTECPALRTVGYAQVMALRAGELKPENLAAAIRGATTQFAKRQITYWRNEPLKRGWQTFPQQGEGEELECTTRGERALRVFRWSRQQLLDQVGRRIKQATGQGEVLYVRADKIFDRDTASLAEPRVSERLSWKL